MNHSDASPRTNSTIRALTALLLFVGCSAPTAVHSIQTSTQNDEQSSFLRVRWFPIDDAKNYSLHIETQEGESIVESEISPLGCTHTIYEGFTSGVCNYDLKRPVSSGVLSIHLGANTTSGIRKADVLRYQ